MLAEDPGSLSPWYTSVMGLSGWTKRYYFSCPLTCSQDFAVFTWVSDHARVPFTPLGRDILSKVHASVFMNMETSLSLWLIEQNINPRVWADGKTGLSTNAIHVVVKLKDPHLFPHQKEYPLKLEVMKGLKSTIENLKEQGLLIPSLTVHAALLLWV